MSNNKIKTLDRNLFLNNIKLDQLYLYSNRIQSFPENMFENCPLTWSDYPGHDKGSKEANIEYWIYRDQN